MPNSGLPAGRPGPARLVALLVALLTGAAPLAAAEAPAEAEPRFEDWHLRCTPACRIETEVRGSGGEVLLRLRFGAAGGEPALAVETPLPLRLPDGVAVGLGRAEPRALPWFTCNAAGCEARLAADPATLARLRGEREATVAFTLVDGERVRLPVSLMGFAAAERALAEARPGVEDQVNERP